MSLTAIVTALEAAGESIVTTPEDIWDVGGETHESPFLLTGFMLY